MYLLFAIVAVLLVAERRRDPLFPLMAAPPVFVAAFYALSWSGAGFTYSLTLDLIAFLGLAAVVAWLGLRRARRRPEWRGDVLATYLMAAAIVALILFAFRHAFLLPPVDPATVPSLARLVYLAGRIPPTLAPMSDAAFIYPPGFSVLVSTLWVLDSPIRLLWVFKIVNLAVVALMPFAWSHFAPTALGIRTVASPLFVATLFVAGFFIFDGTLVLAPVLAGKNAQLLALFLAPAVLHGLLDEHHSVARGTIVALALAGAILIHYSLVYIVALGIAFHFIVDWKHVVSRVPWLAATGGAGVALVVPHYLWMERVGFALPAEYGVQVAPLACVAENLTARAPKFFFIFHDLDLATRWPYRAIVMAVIVVAAVAIDRWLRTRQSNEEPRPGAGGRGDHRARGLSPAAWGVVASAVLLACCLALGCEVIPRMGAGYDYVRWFTFVVTVWLFVCVGLVLRVPRWAQYALSVVVPAWLLVSPMVGEARRFIEAWSHSRAEVAGVARVLSLVHDGGENAQSDEGRASSRPDCRLITSSDRGTSSETRNHITQRYRPFEYAFVLSDCVVVNGTTNYGPEPHARTLDELPSREFYEGLVPGTTVVLFLEPGRFDAYRARVPDVAFEATPYTLQGLRAYRVRSVR